ncbi:MAG: hypothetical protein DHS20C21_01790 [Gemmatimonadota bacterium]|nr:MAG: hypothetical protein DHS20C21_01790 [Gemmatimonadota bacterium]
MAKRFFYLSMGILALTAAYHFGAVRTEAQGGGTFSGIAIDNTFAQPVTVAVTTTGDVYAIGSKPACTGASEPTWVSYECAPEAAWTYMGNIVSGPIPVETRSFGSVKGAFK